MTIIEWINKALETQVGSGAFVVIFFGGIGAAIWLLSSWNTKIKSISKMEDNIDKIRETLGFLKGEFKAFSERNDKLFNAQSPIKINDFGKKVSDELGIKSILGSHWQQIKSCIREQNFSNPYDIQEFCLDFVVTNQDIFSHGEINKMKEIAFNHGLGINSIYRLVGVEMRDKYFEEEGMNIEEIDDHDPEKQKTVA